MTAHADTTGSRPVALSGSPVLSVKGAQRRYGGVIALRGVDFTLQPGEVHALVGENGAGKSTLIKLISGQETPDGGIIDSRLQRSDIAVVHQELAIIPTLSVIDNLTLGGGEKGWLCRRGSKSPQLRGVLDEVGLTHVDLNAKASTLSLAERQLVELARALSRDASIIILDEPTATLTDVEVDRVMTAVRKLRAQGRSVIYVSHRLQEIFALADRVTTLRNGESVSTDDVSTITREELVAKMLGQAVDLAGPGRPSRPSSRDTVVSVTGLSADRRYNDVTLAVSAGEICCLTGQMGSGADSVIRSLAGLEPWSDGSASIAGSRMRSGSIKSSRAAGAAYVPADRANEGVFLDATVQTNISSGILRSLATAGVLKRGRERNVTRKVAESLAVRGTRMGSQARHLSGGNQQKVAIARAVATKPAVMLLDEPTRGVDVGARQGIYEQLRAFADNGMTIVCFTSDMSEVRHFADTVVTMYRGRIVRNCEVRDVKDSDILADILHGSTGGAS